MQIDTIRARNALTDLMLGGRNDSFGNPLGRCGPRAAYREMIAAGIQKWPAARIVYGCEWGHINLSEAQRRLTHMTRMTR